MELENFITSGTGLVHFIASMLALLFGTWALASTKGTGKHKLIGRLYALSMCLSLVTAFMTYRLFGTWGIFHWTAVVSTLTLFCGLVPILIKRPSKSYTVLHFSFMYWSVMGVYAAFISETLVRMPKVVIDSGIPNSVFYSMTGIGSALVMGIAAYYFLKLRPKWHEQFTGMTMPQ